MSETQQSIEANGRATPETFLEGLYGDPLREETSRTGRYLVIVATISIAVVLFKVRLTSTSLIPVDFGERPDVLPMLLALAVLLLLASFIMRASADILRDREVGVLVTRYIERERTEAAEAEARAEEESMFADQEEGSSEPDPWWEPYYTIKEVSDKAVADAEKRLGIRRTPLYLRRIRKWLEVGVPVVLALIAIFLSLPSLLTFFKALAAALI